MKTLVILFVMILVASASKAQEVIELKEARVTFDPQTSIVTNGGKAFSYTIKETYHGEFEKDPMAFVKEHFDIMELIEKVDDENYSWYEINFKSRKGYLMAEYNQNGELVNTSLKFKNIPLPNPICHQLYRDHKGWAMVENTHIARSKNGEMKRNYYKVTMQNGDQIRRIRIDAPATGSDALVSK